MSFSQLKIGSVSACFFKITIFPIPFCNAEWIKISLENLMIELYLHIKIYLEYFPGTLRYVEFGKSIVLHLEFQCQKLLKLYHNTFIILFCIIVLGFII